MGASWAGDLGQPDATLMASHPTNLGVPAMALTTSPLDRRLALRSLVLAFGPEFEVTAAADTLAALADRNRTALLRAIARVRAGADERSGPTAERAAGALRLALAGFHGADTADFLVPLQEAVLDDFPTLYFAGADSTNDGHKACRLNAADVDGDRQFGSPGASA